MIKLLIGGSPCTFWSIAKRDGREVTAEGQGWELFKNYLIAKEKFKPDFFLYENNKSAAQAIKDQIKYELGVDNGDAEYIEINSALVSAQNRQRFYVHNCNYVEQPEDRGILLKDILDTGITDKIKAYCLKHQAGNTRDYFKKHHTNVVFEPVAVNTAQNGDKSCTIKAQYHKISSANAFSDNGHRVTCVLEPIPVNTTENGKSQTIKAQYGKTATPNIIKYTSTYDATGVLQPIRIGDIDTTAQAHRVYSHLGKSVTINSNAGGQGGKTGLYLVPIPECLKGLVCDKGLIYEVKDGVMTNRFGSFDLGIPDGQYIIRKLSVTECCRLQTLPDNYCRAVSNAQAYKGLGNGWTAEVIIHILNGALKDVSRDEELLVLSMYDGIGTGRYCLDKMGFKNVKYYAYEIDKYAKEISMSNYPDIIQMGDAFDIRNDDWKLGDVI